MVYVVRYEGRNEYGHISERIVMTFTTEDDAEAYCARFNEDPSTAPLGATVRAVALHDSLNSTIEQPVKQKDPRGRAQALTADDVMEIRSRYNRGEKAGVLAEDYNVARSTVYRAVSGQNWSWL